MGECWRTGAFSSFRVPVSLDHGERGEQGAFCQVDLLALHIIHPGVVLPNLPILPPCIPEASR